MEELVLQGSLESVGLLKKPVRKRREEEGRLARMAKPKIGQREEWQNEWS